MKKKLISLAISIAILALIYWRIDFARLIAAFAQCRVDLLLVALAMVLPITVVLAWRFMLLAPRSVNLSLAEALRLVLASSVLNMVLPSKMGDLSKVWFMKKKGNVDIPLGLALVVFERVGDVLALLLWCVIGLTMIPRQSLFFWPLAICIALGLIFGLTLLGSQSAAGWFFSIACKCAPGKLAGKFDKLAGSWQLMHAHAWADRKRLISIAAISIALWAMHLFQIWLFMIALRAQVPFGVSLGLTPLAILVGLLPITFAGIGTRDAAIIFFYRSYFSPAVGAAVGLLCTMRYLIPAVAGLPFFHAYLAMTPAPEHDAPIQTPNCKTTGNVDTSRINTINDNANM